MDTDCAERDFSDSIKEKLKLLPDAPGVYIMKDAGGRVIYVGKAVVLKNRVRQYFHSPRNHSPKVRAMVAKVADFETIMTATEVEALILENNLIKKHHPKYNISLRDDKTYPYVKVTLAEDFPRVIVTRRLVRDGSRYFGPYADVGAVHESLKLLRRLFHIRTCKHIEEGRACLEYHIKRCLAPCLGEISQEDYGAMIKSVLLYLEGRTDDVTRQLKKAMAEAAAGLNFERAAALRDQLRAVERSAEKQNIDAPEMAGDRDAIALARSPVGNLACAVVFFVRAGKLVGREYFLLQNSGDETDAAVLRAFIEQYYHRATFIPREILAEIPLDGEAASLLAAWLNERRGAAISLEFPQRGAKKALIEMAKSNAAKYLADEAGRLEKGKNETIGAAEELGRYLGLPNYPERIECFDISHTQGQESVASLVVFTDGAADKGEYRRYKLQTTEGVNDDFLAMAEAMRRRYGKTTLDNPPDLVIVDGGLGQLHAALKIIRGAGHQAIPVIGLAKQFELVFTEGSSEPIELPRRSQALYLIQRIRDEAHRFAITYHRALRKKRNLVSILDHIKGIGPKRRQALWDHFGSIEKIKSATAEELAAAPNMNTPAAIAVHNFFAAIRDGNIGKKL